MSSKPVSYTKPLVTLRKWVRLMDTKLHDKKGHTTKSAETVSKVIRITEHFDHCIYKNQMKQVAFSAEDVKVITHQCFVNKIPIPEGLYTLLLRSENYTTSTENKSNSHEISASNSLQRQPTTGVLEASKPDTEAVQYGLFANR